MRTHFYHGVHLEAIDRDETFDVAFRVWKAPPGGLATVQETFEATLPDVKATAEITPQTWIFDGDDVRAVAFLDREADVGVLLTCGAAQCVDIETAIILAKFVIVSILTLATAALANTSVVQDDDSTFEQMLAGSALLILAAWSPFALLRMLPMMELAATSVVHQRTAMQNAAGSAGARRAP